MTRGSSTLAALVLCLAGLCAVGAASASATVGITAVTCENVGIGHGNFSTNKCETPESVEGSFKTVALPLNETKEAEGDAVETTILHATVALSEVTITCSKAHITGKITNVTPTGETGEMQAHGTEGHSTYEGCEAHLKSKTAAEEACQIEAITGALGKGKIQTTTLTATSGPEHKLSYKSEVGTNITEFNILAEKATTQACNLPKAKVTLTGEVIGQVSTTKHSHVSLVGEGSLKANGAAATITATTTGYKKGQPETTLGGTTIG